MQENELRSEYVHSFFSLLSVGGCCTIKSITTIYTQLFLSESIKYFSFCKTNIMRDFLI